MFRLSADPFAPLAHQLDSLFQNLPVTRWDWNADRYGAWVEWVHQQQLYRLERRQESLASDPAAAVTGGVQALQDIIHALDHLNALAALNLGPWSQWIHALAVSSSRRPVEPCFLLLGFAERPVDPLEVRDRYRQLCQPLDPDNSHDQHTLLQLREALDDALHLLTPSIPSSS
jgi:hypothetical protein